MRTDEAYMQWMFNRVDSNGNGQIDAAELQNALSNGTNIPFNLDTVNVFIGKFRKIDLTKYNREKIILIEKIRYVNLKISIKIQ